MTVSLAAVTAAASAAAAGRPAAPSAVLRHVQPALRSAVTNLTGTPVAVSTVSASDAWAVEGTNLVLHWNGTSWVQTALPEYGTGSYLDAVDAVSATDVWTVGYYTTTAGKTQALAAHWNGTRWTLVTAPNPAKGGFLDLNGVSAASPSDIWAVGTYGNQKTLALHWNGTSWTQVATPSPGYAGNALSAVAAVSPSVAWADGSYDVFRQTGAIPTKTLLLRWNGTHWTQVSTPNPGAAVSTLNGVAASSASDAWAVGFYQLPPSGGTTTSKTLMLRWNGAAWTRS